MIKILVRKHNVIYQSRIDESGPAGNLNVGSFVFLNELSAQLQSKQDLLICI